MVGIVAALAAGFALGTGAFYLKNWAAAAPLATPAAVGAVAADGGSSPAAAAQLADHDARLLKLEREFPQWHVAMSALADQAGELLDQAERKRRSAKQAERRAFEAGGPEGGEQPPLGNPEQLGRGAQPLDPGQQRAQILAIARSRRGGR